VEAVTDPGLTGDDPGAQAEGLPHDGAGVPPKGVHPRNRYLAVAAPAKGGEPVHLLWGRPPIRPSCTPSSLRTRGTC
jgi:alpha-mannosidase